MQRLASVPYADVLREGGVYGTPEAVVECLQEYEGKLGVSGVILEMNYGGHIPHDRVVNSIRLLTGKVMPKFK